MMIAISVLTIPRKIPHDRYHLYLQDHHTGELTGDYAIDYLPEVGVVSYQSEGHGSVTNNTVSDTNEAGTGQWTNTDSITWKWNEVLNKGVYFPSYSNTPSAPNSPAASVAFVTRFSYGVSGDSFTNGQVSGKKSSHSNIQTTASLDNVTLKLVSSTSFDNFESPDQPPSISGSTGSYNYEWDFDTVTSGNGDAGVVGLNNSSITFTPGFDASVSPNNTTFTASGTQILTVNVTPEEALISIGISLNLAEDQYFDPTIESVTPAGGVPTTYGIYPGGKNLYFPINSPAIGATYTYMITIQVNLQNGVTQLDYMPSVLVYAYQSVTSGSVTGTSVSAPANDISSSGTVTQLGTWTWSSTDDIIWNLVEGLGRCVNFPSYETATITTATTISGGGTSVSQNDGVVVGITGSTASSGTGVTISSTNYGSIQPSGTGAIQLTGSPQYYDVYVSSSSGLGTGATAEVSITSPSVTTNTIIQYWYNGEWNTATNISVSGTTISGDIPVSALTGTPIVIGTDTTPPTITITAPVNGAVYYLNQAVNANWNATDLGSGVATATGTVPSGSPINTSKVGNYSFTVSATDKAGNTATSTVNYSICGNAVTALSGNINVGNSTNVTSSTGLSIGGNILANGSISLGNTIKINGNATASGSITKGNNDIISGSSATILVSGNPAPSLPYYRHRVPFHGDGCHLP